MNTTRIVNVVDARGHHLAHSLTVRCATPAGRQQRRDANALVVDSRITVIGNLPHVGDQVRHIIRVHRVTRHGEVQLVSGWIRAVRHCRRDRHGIESRVRAPIVMLVPVLLGKNLPGDVGGHHSPFRPPLTVLAMAARAGQDRCRDWCCAARNENLNRASRRGLTSVVNLFASQRCVRQIFRAGGRHQCGEEEGKGYTPGNGC